MGSWTQRKPTNAKEDTDSRKPAANTFYIISTYIEGMNAISAGQEMLVLRISMKT